MSEITLRPIAAAEDECYQQLLERHHCPIPKIGQTLRYEVQYGQIWVALLRFSASSLKSAPRDHWIGWDARLLFGCLKLIANNSRFLILPDLHQPCLGAKVRALPESFQAIGEPRRAQGRRHPIRAVLGNRRRGLQVHVHVMSAVGHESRAAYTQKESPA